MEMAKFEKEFFSDKTLFSILKSLKTVVFEVLKVQKASFWVCYYDKNAKFSKIFN
jgi:hypothetical protein